jgi:segregation and condensation protein B
MELKFILESILFSAQEPLSPKEIRDILVEACEHSEEARPFKKVKADDISAHLEQLAADHDQAGRSYRLACVAGSWQFCTQPEFAPWIKALVGEKHRPTRLSQPALETLAIIAYRQPITRAEIEQIRGVTIDGVLQTLLERGLVQQAGRAEVIGRPMTFATTATFLEYFGLRSLEDLPAADELRRVPVQKPDSLLTVDPGLATAPPEQLQVVAAEGAETKASSTGSAPQEPKDSPETSSAPEPEAQPPATPPEPGAS